MISPRQVIISISDRVAIEKRLRIDSRAVANKLARMLTRRGMAVPLSVPRSSEAGQTDKYVAPLQQFCDRRY